MNRLALLAAFRQKMLPLVILAGLVVAGSAPAAFYFQKRGELVTGARATAARAATLVLEVAGQRPRLWQYDAGKLSERFAAEGLSRQPIVIHDARGVGVPIEIAPPRGALVWGRAPVILDGKPLATVWVGADTAELNRATLELALGFFALALGLGAVLYLLPVRAIAFAEQRIRALVTTLQEDDRRRIARDLHDGAGQALTAARLRLLALRKQVDIDAIARHLDDALEEIRRSTAALLPPALDELGLGRAVERHCLSFGEAAGLSIECELSSLPPLPAPVELACYRIVQEALTNTARHAGATRAWVKLAGDGDRVKLEIGDDGVGMKDGARLDSIRERVRLVGGSLALSGNQLQVTL